MVVKEASASNDIDRIMFDEQVVVAEPSDLIKVIDECKKNKKWCYNEWKGSDGYLPIQTSTAIRNFWKRFMWDYMIIASIIYYTKHYKKNYWSEYIEKNKPTEESYNKQERRYKYYRKGKTTYFSFKNEEDRHIVYNNFIESWSEMIQEKPLPKKILRRLNQTLNKVLTHFFNWWWICGAEITDSDNDHYKLSKYTAANQYFNYQQIHFNEFGFGWITDNQQGNCPHYRIHPKWCLFKRKGAGRRRIDELINKKRVINMWINNNKEVLDYFDKKTEFIKETLKINHRSMEDSVIGGLLVSTINTMIENCDYQEEWVDRCLTPVIHFLIELGIYNEKPYKQWVENEDYSYQRNTPRFVLEMVDNETE